MTGGNVASIAPRRLWRLTRMAYAGDEAAILELHEWAKLHPDEAKHQASRDGHLKMVLDEAKL